MTVAAAARKVAAGLLPDTRQGIHSSISRGSGPLDEREKDGVERATDRAVNPTQEHLKVGREDRGGEGGEGDGPHLAPLAELRHRVP
jgi:hypothetical protein